MEHDWDQGHHAIARHAQPGEGSGVKKLSKSEAAQSECSVDTTEAYSVLPVTKMAVTLGYDALDHGG